MYAGQDAAPDHYSARKALSNELVGLDAMTSLYEMVNKSISILVI